MTELAGFPLNVMEVIWSADWPAVRLAPATRVLNTGGHARTTRIALVISAAVM
jgi:hypothetical protein